MNAPPASATRLRRIKTVHTIAWAFFVACIGAIPVLAWTGRFHAALLLIGIVLIEVIVIILNGWHCPLTAVAARYTDDRRPNFDIYLPEWLARYNKEIFGTLFAIGILLTLALRLLR
jgi:Na+/proline symporter